MADFLNGLQQNFPASGNPGNSLLNTGVDKDRNNFLTGLQTTTSGQKEDPTYLGFRLLFDLNPGNSVDQETFLPISPLLCVADQINMPHIGAGVDYFSLSKQIRVSISGTDKQNNLVPNVTQNFYFYSAKGYLTQRRSSAENGSAPGGGSSAQSSSNRADALIGFRNILQGINAKSPWFIQSVEGLDSLLKIPQSRSYAGDSVKEKISRSGILTFNCLDSIDLRVTAMADLYRKATYDTINLKSVIPQNLRKFRMWIIVTELRNMHLTSNLTDVLNPFGNSAISNLTTTVGNIAQSSGILNTPAGPPNASDPLQSRDSVYGSLSKLEPYIFMYQLDQCEFDFDEYAHIPSTLSNADNRKPVDNRFKIHVGKIIEKKLQYNILSDLLQNQSQFSPILIADSWNLAGSTLATDYSVNNDGNLFAKLANNFINNSVSSVIQKYSPIVSQAVLGNVYQGSLLSSLTQGISNLGQGNVSGAIQSITNNPSSTGSLGLPSRVYPSISDVDYSNEGAALGVPNRIYSTPSEDVYSNNPGTDLGLPSRVYPTINDIDYSNEATALGVPDRVYPAPSEDVYPTVEGVDLGLPDRVYPNIVDDEYTNDPGSDLGVPDRVYPAPSEDVYPTVEGTDLGLPSRVYPNITEDDYITVPGADLGVPDRVYPAPSEDTYPTVEGVDLGLPSRVYPNIVDDEYPNDPGSDLGVPSRVYPTPSEDVYPTVEGTDLGLPDRVYPSIVADEYPNDPGSDLGLPGRVYNIPNEDLYKTDPGVDLGLPDRVYPHIEENDYTNTIGKVYPPIEDLYKTDPGIDLGLPGRVYPNISDNEYEDQGITNSIVPKEDVYSNNSTDFGLPSRVYSNITENDYNNISTTTNIPSEKIYPKNISTYPSINSRVYPISSTPNQIEPNFGANKDAYPTVPGKDLGLPNRDYPIINKDQ